MAITHIVGFHTEHDAKIEALAQQSDGFHTIVAGAADAVHLAPIGGEEAYWAESAGSWWIVIATDGKLETVTAPAAKK